MTSTPLRSFALASTAAVLVAGCAAEGDAFLGRDDVADATAPGVHGRVWAPGNGPGDVPAGREVPVAGALVRLLARRPDPIPDGVHCRDCLETGGWWATFSDATGRFVLEDVDPGEYWLIIEAGPFRRDVPVYVDPAVRAVRVEDEATELPSVHDPASGRFAPRVALLSGAFDPAGHLLGQLGFGDLREDGLYSPDPRLDRVDVFYNGGDAAISEAGHAHSLLRDPARLARYHVLLVPSSDAGGPEAALALAADAEATRNLRDWVAAGGVLIATGHSASLVDRAWPGALTFAEGDVPPEAYDADTDTWRPEHVPAPVFDTRTYDSPHARVLDSQLAAWLGAQRGPGYALYHWGPDGVFTGPDPRLVGPYDPVDLPILGSTRVLTRLASVVAEGMPPRVLLEGENGSGDLLRGPVAVTFAPPGCGRLMVSTAPLAPVTPRELTVMERVALHFLVSTPVCTRAPI